MYERINITRFNHKIKIIYCFAVMISMFVIIFLNNTSITRWPIVVLKIENRSNYSENRNRCVISRIHNVSRGRPKHILLWTNPKNVPFIYLGRGNAEFVKRKCEWSNCYVTSNRRYLGHYTEFDVVAFNGPQLTEMIGNDDRPTQRSPHQKYVYANIEAATNYPICSNTWDDFFNWTWTYKLDSDAVWGYYVVKNSSGNVIAPSTHVNWVNTDKMNPIDNVLKEKLNTKRKAAAWFVSNCNTMSSREMLVAEIRLYMNYYNLDIDIYGLCGSFSCPKETMEECFLLLERDYYFYFAFENALSEDYVTEKVLNALHHYTVPVVYGGANYSRFLPPGSYLDAHELGAQKLAKEMYNIVQNPEKYHAFFRWKSHYSFHYRYESPDTDDYCRFCAMLNDDTLVKRKTIYHNMSDWWTTYKMCNVLKSTDFPNT